MLAGVRIRCQVDCSAKVAFVQTEEGFARRSRQQDGRRCAQRTWQRAVQWRSRLVELRAQGSGEASAASSQR
eukprot:1108876-Pleurochrysis_carterae.AAC.3